jgi:hypothetical protein
MQQSAPIDRKIVVAFVLLLCLFGFAFSINNLIVGSEPVIKLEPAPPLAGVVSQSLGSNVSTSTSLPVANKDYRLNVTYFDNKKWAIGVVSPINNGFNAGLEVLKQQDGQYQVVLGPGSTFPDSQVKQLPSDVAAYLRARAAVYQSTAGQ